MDKFNDSDTLKVGQVVYSINGKKNDDFWDDQELIDHWEATKELYKRQYSKFKKEDPPPPFSNNKSSMQKKRKLNEKQTPIPKKNKSKQMKTNFINDSIPSQPIPSYHSIPPPQSVQSYPFPYNYQQYNDESITQLIHAWYLYGYYNGYMEGKSKENNQ